MSEKKELSMAESRAIQFDMLCEIDSFCRKNKITYYLGNGTLLGAVKYKGFIPWDDDIDILMPRKDYDFFVETYVNTDSYSLFSIERDKRFRFPFAKFCDTRTVKDEYEYNNGVKLGLDIDVFPIDDAHSMANAISIVQSSRKLMNHLFWAKIKILPSRNAMFTILKGIRVVLYRLFGASRICKMIIMNANRYIDKPMYRGCFVWPIYGESEILPEELFSDTVEVEFEGKSFFAPKGYDAYLRSLYGDYWQDPPIDKQKTHHRFKVYQV